MRPKSFKDFGTPREVLLIRTLFLLTALVAAPLPAMSEGRILERSAQRSGAWLALELVEEKTGRTFCAAETDLPGGGVFRVNFYSPVRSFIEVFPLDRQPGGPASIIFDSDDYDLRVSAISPRSRDLLQNLGVWQ